MSSGGAQNGRKWYEKEGLGAQHSIVDIYSMTLGQDDSIQVHIESQVDAITGAKADFDLVVATSVEVLGEAGVEALVP